jgi:hypothetical protein
MHKHFIHHVTKKPIPDISLSAVKSSQVKEVGYDPATKTLAVTFAHGKGAVYHYPGVTQEAFDAFKGAESIGTHFGKHIKSLPFDKYVKPD